MESDAAIDRGVLRTFLGPSADAFVRRAALPGLITVPAASSIGASETHALCDLALAHECESLERSLEADHGELDRDGDACGASFCGFYRERDIFTWADDLEAQAAATPASHAVRLVRGAIEAAIAGEGVQPLLPVGASPMRCEAWLNVLRHGDFLRLHDHSGALISGVLWLHVPTGTAASDGKAADAAVPPWWSGAFLAARQAADGTGAEYCVVRAQEGWCAFFPGSLHHAVLPLYAPGSVDAGDEAAADDELRAIRISLSFNYTAITQPGVGASGVGHGHL